MSGNNTICGLLVPGSKPTAIWHATSSLNMHMTTRKYGKLTFADLIEDGLELRVLLSKNLGQVDMRKIAFLMLLALLVCSYRRTKLSYLPCLTPKSPFVRIWPHIVATAFVLTSVLELLVFFFVDKLPSASYAVGKWLHRGELAELCISSAVYRQIIPSNSHLQ